MSWKEVPLGELYLSKGGSIDPRKFPNETFELYSIPAYDKKLSEISLGSKIGSSKKCIRENDVLLSRIVPHIRRCWVVGKANGYRQIGSGEWIIFRSNKVLPNYLRSFLLSDKFHVQFMQTIAGVGGSLLRARPTEVIKIKIPIPPLDVQEKIANILNTADKLKQKDNALIAKYNELSQSLFLDMFGDIIRNPKNWQKLPLEKLCTIRRGASPRPIKNFVGGNVPWIKIGDGTNNSDGIFLTNTKEAITEEGAKKSVLLDSGSLIFANCGVSLGFARILKIKGCIHDGWLSMEHIDKERLNKIFLLKTINSVTDFFRRTAPDGTQPNLNTGIMKKFEIPLPPIELQNEFEKKIFSIEKQKQQAQASLKKSEELFNCLLQKAFKGELVT